MKVSELSGALLDAAVAKACGYSFAIVRGCCVATVPDREHGDGNGLVGFSPSEYWNDCGPIIDRERIALDPGWQMLDAGSWEATVWPAGKHDLEQPFRQIGDTPLIAAMRAYVASKFGEEVEL